MKTYVAIFVAILLASFSFGCGTQGPVEPNQATIKDVAGVWSTVSIVYQSQAEPSNEIDASSIGDWRSLMFDSDGAFEMEGSRFGNIYTSDGTARIEGDKLFLNFGSVDDEGWEYEFELEEDRLTIRDRTANADFDGDGRTESAIEIAVYAKAPGQ